MSSTALISVRPQIGAEHGATRNRTWQLAFERERSLEPDPLTGWAGGGGDARADQVRLLFDSPEDAVAYCERQGLKFEVSPEPPHRLHLQSYADNFR